MKLKLLIAAALLLVSSCSRNENPDKWIQFSSNNNSKLFYTRDRMSKDDGKIVKVWVKTAFNEMQRADDQDISYSKNLFMMDCGNRTYKVNAGINYSPDGKIVSKGSGSGVDLMTDIFNRPGREDATGPDKVGKNGYLPIEGGSAADRLYGIVCK